MTLPFAEVMSSPSRAMALAQSSARSAALQASPKMAKETGVVDHVLIKDSFPEDATSSMEVGWGLMVFRVRFFHPLMARLDSHLNYAMNALPPRSASVEVKI